MTRSSPSVSVPAAVVLRSHDAAWQRFVDGHPDRLPVHDRCWTDALAETYGFRPFVIAVADGGGSLEGGIPLAEVRDPLRGRRWIALPFTDCCPALLAHPGAQQALTGALADAAAAAGIERVEVRAPLDGCVACAVAATHVLDLSPGSDALQRRFTPAARRNVRRATREGVVLRRATSEGDLVGVFYRLHLRTRHRLGVPIQPRRFFRALWRHVLAPGHGDLILAWAGDVPIAGAVFLRGGRTVLYKYGASDERAWPMRANNLLFADAISRSAEQGYARLDFGRTDLADVGLRSFKRGWGATEEPLLYSRLRGGGASTGPSGGQLLRTVIRRSPPGVCRVIGEMLYRYAA